LHQAKALHQAVERLAYLNASGPFASSAIPVFLQKSRSTLQPGKDVFDGRDSPGLIALG
jgi:hypothetical protein